MTVTWECFVTLPRPWPLGMCFAITNTPEEKIWACHTHLHTLILVSLVAFTCQLRWCPWEVAETLATDGYWGTAPRQLGVLSPLRATTKEMLCELKLNALRFWWSQNLHGRLLWKNWVLLLEKGQLGLPREMEGEDGRGRDLAREEGWDCLVCGWWRLWREEKWQKCPGPPNPAGCCQPHLLGLQLCGVLFAEHAAHCAGVHNGVKWIFKNSFVL